jgi:hypothetical protein
MRNRDAGTHGVEGTGPAGHSLAQRSQAKDASSPEQLVCLSPRRFDGQSWLLSGPVGRLRNPMNEEKAAGTSAYRSRAYSKNY